MHFGHNEQCKKQCCAKWSIYRQAAPPWFLLYVRESHEYFLVFIFFGKRFAEFVSVAHGSKPCLLLLHHLEQSAAEIEIAGRKNGRRRLADINNVR